MTQYSTKHTLDNVSENFMAYAFLMICWTCVTLAEFDRDMDTTKLTFVKGPS